MLAGQRTADDACAHMCCSGKTPEREKGIGLAPASFAVGKRSARTLLYLLLISDDCLEVAFLRPVARTDRTTGRAVSGDGHDVDIISPKKRENEKVRSARICPLPEALRVERLCAGHFLQRCRRFAAEMWSTSFDTEQNPGRDDAANREAEKVGAQRMESPSASGR